MTGKNPTKDTIANRIAGMELLHEAARRGNRICLEDESLDGLAAASGLHLESVADFADEDDGWDNVRPF